MRDCEKCSQQLEFFSALSMAMRKLTLPDIPREMLWRRITAALDETRHPTEPGRLQVIKPRKESPWWWAILSTAAVAIIALGLSWAALTNGRHQEPLRAYACLLDANPQAAQQQLSDAYSGRTVSPNEVAQLVGYRPRNVDAPPGDYICKELVVLNMPCCKCVQAIWQRNDESQLAVFEHESKMDDWFADEPSIRIECAGTVCRVTQLDGQLVASWRVGSRVVTVIGIRDTDELARLVAAFS